jgi:hypothetical protein
MRLPRLLLFAQPAEPSQFALVQLVDAVVPAFTPNNVQSGAGKIDLAPAQPDQLRPAQAVTVRDQDHHPVALAVASALLGRLDQLVDLALGQVLTLRLGTASNRTYPTVAFSVISARLVLAADAAISLIPEIRSVVEIG